MSTAPTPSRGEVWLVDFDPAVGAEIQKVRPALVISVDSVGRLPLRMIVPVTEQEETSCVPVPFLCDGPMDYC